MRWRPSAEDGVRYGEQHGVNARTLTWWASQLRDEVARRAMSTSEARRMFVAVREASHPAVVRRAPTSAGSEGTIEISLANGVCLRVVGEVPSEMLAMAVAAAQVLRAHVVGAPGSGLVPAA